MKVYELGDPAAEKVLVQMIDDHDMGYLEDEFSEIASSCSHPLRMIALKVNDWNRDLSPWEAPAVFGNENFGDGAGNTLKELLEFCRDEGKVYYIGGYSLSALFALWAVCSTGCFKGAAAASPSMWFPGFTEYMKEAKIGCKDIYLSLGDKEEKTRNPVMATVGDKIREARDILLSKDINCILEWNKGNHFKDAGHRTAKAFIWLLEQH